MSNKTRSLLRSRNVFGLLSAALLFSAAPRAQAQSFSVNFADDQGPVTHAMSGWLYSWWHTREAPVHGTIELNPTSWRVGYWGTWDYEYQPMLDAGIKHIQIILSDVFRNRGTGNWGGFAHDPSWQSLSYPQTVARTVELINRNNWDKIAFDLINEPDAFGGETGGSDWFNNAWVPAFRIIRELRPQAEIVGPGFFSPNLNHLRTFLEKAKEANVVPDIIAQHLLDSGSNGVVQEFDQAIRGLLTEYGLAQRPITFNEYINPGNVRFVQRRIETISQGERVGVHSAMHSSWDDSGELPPWNSTGDWPSFDGIMSIPAQAERAPYWVYKFYGDMSGRRVWTSGNPNAWEGMATLDIAKPVARIMLGGSSAGANVTVNLNNIPAAFGSPVDVLIERVHTSGNEDLWRAPIQHSRQNMTVNNGSVSFSLSGLPWGVAVMVTVQRSDQPAQVAQPTFNPHRGAYWKPIAVTLSTASSGSTIRYTTDGSEPTASSPLYTGPIDVPVTTTIRAVAFKAGMASSEIANGGFKIHKYYNGLFGEYFNNITLSGAPVLTRGDRQINQNFGGARWDASLPISGFSARWTGRMRPPVTGTYQLHTATDDGARLWIDGNLVIDNWQVQSLTTNTASLPLIGGQDYDLRMEYFNNSGSPMIARLEWTPPGGTRQLIPTARLFPHTAPSGGDLLIPAGTTWTYLAPSGPAEAPAEGWQNPGFDDSSWNTGPARIGYGNQGEVTAIATSPYRPKALYFRRTFNVPNPNALAATLRLQLMRDDGAVIYLNGEELLRDNMPEGEISYGTFATASIGSAWRNMPVRYLLPREKLLVGENTIAVEVHNASASGSDMGFDLWLYNPTRVTTPFIGPIADRNAFPGEPIPQVSFTVDDGEVWASSLMTSATSSNPGLIPNETIETSGWGRSRMVTFTPNAGQTGTAQITVTVDNGLQTVSRAFTVTVVEPPVNTPPTISDVNDRTILPNAMSDEILFDVSDGETEPGRLAVTAISSNPSLIASSNLFINGTGGWRTLSIRPSTGQSGTAVITLTVSDGSLTASDTFTVTVNDPPPVGTGGGLCGTYYNNKTLSGTPVLTRTEAVDFNWGTASPGPGVNADNFSVRWTGQVQAPFSGNYIFRTISDDGVRLWVNGNLVIENWTDHAPTANDSSAISLSVGNHYAIVMEYYESVGGAEARLQWLTPGSGAFVAIPADRLYCAGPNTPPIISDITDRTINMNTGTGPIPFTIGDAETAATNLTLSGSSSNTGLVPNANIVFGGSGSNRTVTVTPAPSQIGSTTITVTVGDGTLTASDTFVLTVTSGALPVAYNFDDGTLQGWTVVSTDAQGRQYFSSVPPSLNSPHTTPQAGSGFIGLHIPAFTLTAPAYTQDSPHNTLWLRSPEFTLNGAGNLTAWLSGGGPGSPNLANTSVAAVPLSSVNNGFRGVALRNVNTGMFVLSGSKTSEGNGWQQVTFTAGQLASFPQGDAYTLDLIDAAQGGWGWVNLDSVSIPGTLVTTSPPVLTIQKWTGNQMRLSWPISATGFTLQRSADAGSGYTNAGLAVVTEGGEFVAYDVPSGDQMFYRLTN
jgi:hypothetical protein